MLPEKPTAEDESDEIYAPLTPEELEKSRAKLAKRTGRFGHHVQIDVPLVNHPHPQNKKPKG